MPPRSRSPRRVPSGYEINPATGRKRKRKSKRRFF
jgi:hypothetical protein